MTTTLPTPEAPVMMPNPDSPETDQSPMAGRDPTAARTAVGNAETTGVAMHDTAERIGIFVIAYNAESHIRRTLSRIPRDVWERVEDVYIVDDCSTDETVRQAVELQAVYPKLHILRNPVNRRYGGNQKVGFQYAIDQGYDMVVMLHADGQYAPECLADMISPLCGGRADVVLGSRMIHREDALKGGMPKYKFFGNIVLTGIQNTLAQTRLHEFHTGYRAYRVDFLKRIPFWDNADEWHFDTEILLQAHAASATIVEISIPTYYGDEICHVNGMVYAMHCILTTLRFAMYRTGILYSRNFDIQISGSRYGSKFDDPYSSHSLLYADLQHRGMADRHVLELGVGDAALTRRLHADGAIIDCVELDPAAAANARQYARRVITGRVEDVRLADLDQPYDSVIAADILEHLVDPEATLSRLKTCVKHNGLLLVSLPNVANLYVRLNLLLGRFPYHTKGILDRTHLHFYTRTSAEQMLRKTGWVVERRAFSSIPIASVLPFLQRRPFRWSLHLLHGLTHAFKGLFSYQILLFAKNPNASDLL